MEEEGDDVLLLLSLSKDDGVGKSISEELNLNQSKQLDRMGLLKTLIRLRACPEVRLAFHLLFSVHI